jgi:hypothetical protein
MARAAAAAAAALPPATLGDLLAGGEAPRSAALEQLLALHNDTRAALEQFEARVYEEENDYIQSTPYGNVVRGWEGLADSRPTTHRNPLRTERAERVFSLSSCSFTNRHPEFAGMRENERDGAGAGEGSSSSSSSRAPRSHAAVDMRNSHKRGAGSSASGNNNAAVKAENEQRRKKRARAAQARDDPELAYV